MLARAERMHRQFFQPVRSRLAAAGLGAAGRCLETEREVLVVVALPGVEPEQVEAAIDGGDLVVAGNAHAARRARARPSSTGWSCRRAASSAACALPGGPLQRHPPQGCRRLSARAADQSGGRPWLKLK